MKGSSAHFASSVGMLPMRVLQVEVVKFLNTEATKYLCDFPSALYIILYYLIHLIMFDADEKHSQK